MGLLCVILNCINTRWSQQLLSAHGLEERKRGDCPNSSPQRGGPRGNLMPGSGSSRWMKILLQPSKRSTSKSSGSPPCWRTRSNHHLGTFLPMLEHNDISTCPSQGLWAHSCPGKTVWWANLNKYLGQSCPSGSALHCRRSNNPSAPLLWQWARARCTPI